MWSNPNEIARLTWPKVSFLWYSLYLFRPKFYINWCKFSLSICWLLQEKFAFLPAFSRFYPHSPTFLSTKLRNSDCPQSHHHSALTDEDLRFVCVIIRWMVSENRSLAELPWTYYFEHVEMETWALQHTIPSCLIKSSLHHNFLRFFITSVSYNLIWLKTSLYSFSTLHYTLYILEQ